LSASRRCSAALAALALLAAQGCAPLKADLPTPEGSVEVFSARGEVITQIGSEPPSRALFRWRRTLEQGEENDSLLVLTPSGTALFRIERGPDRLALRTARGQEVEGDEAREMLARETGWTVPLGAAAYWLRCLSEPGSSTVERVSLTEKRIEQHEWEVVCSRYDEQGRPMRLRLEREGTVLLIGIERWKG